MCTQLVLAYVMDIQMGLANAIRLTLLKKNENIPYHK